MRWVIVSFIVFVILLIMLAAYGYGSVGWQANCPIVPLAGCPAHRE